MYFEAVEAMTRRGSMTTFDWLPNIAFGVPIACRGQLSQANASNSRSKTVRAARSYILRPASLLVRTTTAAPQARSTTNST